MELVERERHRSLSSRDQEALISLEGKNPEDCKPKMVQQQRMNNISVNFRSSSSLGCQKAEKNDTNIAIVQNEDSWPGLNFFSVVEE